MLRLAFLLATIFFPKDILLAPTMIFGSMMSAVAPSDSLPAFPEAEGWGALALNACRSLPVVVHRVTNTNDSGAGSLRTALGNVASSSFDIIVFTTGGTVAMLSEFKPNAFVNCVYIAGQTAPGGGIQLNGEAGAGNMFRMQNQDDWVFRYFRIRNGVDTTAGPCGACGTLRFSGTGGATNIVVDHMSAGWTADGTFGIWRLDNTTSPQRAFTWSRNIVHEGLVNHSTGMNIGGRASLRASEGTYDISILLNLWIHNNGRNPNGSTGDPDDIAGTGGLEVVNNVVYNWGKEIGANYWPAVDDYVNNYYKEGNNDNGRKIRIQIWENGVESNPWPELHSIYVAGNLRVDINDVDITPANQWDFLQNDSQLGSNIDEGTFRRLTRLDPPPIHAVTELTAAQALTSVLADVGANNRLACDAASWIDMEDASDARVIADVQNGTGQHISFPSEVGGFPTLASGTACTDDDTDGLPNAFELMCGGDATSLAVDGDISGDGYLNIEEYVNGTNANGVDLDWTDNATNEDGFYIDRDTGSGFARYDSVAANITTYFDESGIPGYGYRVGAHNTDGESAVAGPVTIACR